MNPRRIAVSGALIIAVIGLAAAAYASGVLYDNGVMVANLDPGNLANRGCGVAFDGTYYWAGEAGTSTGNTLNQYDASGVLLNAYQSGVDHRSIFTDGVNDLYAMRFGGGDLVRYTGGVPSPVYALNPSSPNAQSEHGLRISNNSLYGHNSGTIYVYDFATGLRTSSFGLSGYSATYPADVQLAVANGAVDYLLTYDDAGNVAAWDFAGNQVGLCAIGLVTFDQKFSFSFANGLLWIETARNGTWNGYDIGLGMATAIEPTTWGAIKASF